jgi:hypothetical protein
MFDRLDNVLESMWRNDPKMFPYLVRSQGLLMVIGDADPVLAADIDTIIHVGLRRAQVD